MSVVLMGLFFVTAESLRTVRAGAITPRGWNELDFVCFYRRFQVGYRVQEVEFVLDHEIIMFSSEGQKQQINLIHQTLSIKQVYVSLPVMPNGQPFGISFIQTPDPDLTRDLTVIRVLKIQPQSLAALAGVRVGDELVAVGSAKVGLYSPQFRQQVGA